MAASVIDTATDLGRKLVNRAQTVVGDDYREAKRQARDFANTFRSENKGRSKTKKSSTRKTGR